MSNFDHSSDEQQRIFGKTSREIRNRLYC